MFSSPWVMFKMSPLALDASTKVVRHCLSAIWMIRWSLKSNTVRICLLSSSTFLIWRLYKSVVPWCEIYSVYQKLLLLLSLWSHANCICEFLKVHWLHFTDVVDKVIIAYFQFFQDSMYQNVLKSVHYWLSYWKYKCHRFVKHGVVTNCRKNNLSK